MKISTATLAVLRAVSLAVLFAVLAAHGQAESHNVKLLSATTGWATSDNHIYWTVNGGSDWKDITPLPAGLKRVTIEHVFFRDTSEGWVLVSHKQTAQPGASRLVVVYEMAHTDNGGISWSFAPLKFPKSPTEPWRDSESLRPRDFYFVDGSRGWLVVREAGSSGVSPGNLLATVDGGNSWNWVGSPQVSGSVVFISPKDGWLAGGPDNRELYVTHDGAQTWEKVTLTLPPQVSLHSYTVFQTPSFTDSLHGLLAVKYPGTNGVKQSKLVVFLTSDAGKTWKPTKVLTYSREKGDFSVTFANGKLIVPTLVDDEQVRVVQISLGDEASITNIGSPAGVSGLSFYDAEHGVVMSKPGLLATFDGGVSWKNVTPWHRSARRTLGLG
jgi:photosystem II stability/assembly factor-like uncharacterized protein